MRQQPAGFLPETYDAVWRPMGPIQINYGHNIETAWMLLEAVQVLERPEVSAVLERSSRAENASSSAPWAGFLGGGANGGGAFPPAAAQRFTQCAKDIGAYAAQHGRDSCLGGFMYLGSPLNGPTDTDRVWWTQAEAAVGAARLFDATGDSEYLHLLDGTLAWITQFQWDQQYGEWFWAVHANGTVAAAITSADAVYPGTTKGTVWKAGYHTGRALLLLSQWLQQQQQK